MKDFEYYIPQHLIFGCGSINKLASMELPGKKALIVTMEDRLYVDKVTELLEQNNTEYVIFDKVRANPNTDNVNEGARIGIDNNCDFVISIGGGSPVDAAKCIAMLMHEDPYKNDIWEYVAYYEGHKKPTGCLPHIAISTTAGTGSEVVPGGVISNDKLNVKLDIGDSVMFPTFSIMDPELHLTLPKNLTAIIGMDVVFHAIEGYLDIQHNPYTDMIYLETLRYTNRYLVRAYNNLNDLEARSGMAIATNLAGMGESLVDVMSLHAMAHTLGSFHHELPHGLALCLLAPETLSFYCSYPEETRRRMGIIAETLACGDTPEDLVSYVIELLKKLGLYNIDYSEYGIDISRAAEYAHHTVYDIAPYMDKDEHSCTVSEIEQIFASALERNRIN